MEPDAFDDVMVALASAHRREMIRFLGLQPNTISTLAGLRGLSLPAIHKHVAVLEKAGLITRRKVGRSNVLTLNPLGLKNLQDWLSQFHTWWGAEGATLGNYATYLDSSEVDKADSPRTTTRKARP